ncbi:unnamed protein product [Lathyrus sativus]|nr:unnamed protein product [Lathyrus sativus]
MGIHENWEEVRRGRNRGEKQSRRSIWTTRGHKVSIGVEDRATSFFFTEFPDGFEAKEMFDIFKEYGRVLEVVIPPKRDKRGKRYKFVRLKNVDDEKLMAIKLDSVMIKGRKLYTNVPKF